MNKKNERRDNLRAPMGVTVKWTTDGRQWNEDSAKDISKSGMMLLVKRATTPNSKIKIQFKLPNIKMIDPIIATANVVRTIIRNKRQRGIGLRFLSFTSNKNQKLIEAYICRLLGMPMPQMAGAEFFSGHTAPSHTLDRFAQEAVACEQTDFCIKDGENNCISPFAFLTRHGLKIGLTGLTVFILFKLSIMFLDIIEHLKSITH